MNLCCALSMMPAEWKLKNVITYFKGRTFPSLIVNCLQSTFLEHRSKGAESNI